ncbi:MAG: carbon-nitrogen hydrolase [Verrucomicrobiales bacterium]|jgi:N-carbamoylputrescine amidase|nr:carbon-nitrogen hydrolase [Verrucomicrobiales bacterium]MDB2346873.1 carbon-nitrogen hydrolase [Verrucomicrobiales bacterium]MDF1787977.1 carbon-nitrogen hydrolase [Verrucomicrobiales bacterium]NCF85185.1 acyltransferase [Verrucomicrobiaceae bacterium]
MKKQVTLGLPQFAALPEPTANLARAETMIRQAASQGAQIVCLQELCSTLYFCQIEDPTHFDLTEAMPGPTTDRFGQLAKELGIVIVLPLFEKRATGVYHNTAAVIDADGTLLGKYRKMHIPEDPGFHEKFYFTPGDLGYQAWETAFGTIGVLICWDQWYPEAARLTAMQGADILFYPTAIGWLLEEKDTLGPAQHNAWQTVQRGHAVANGCYVAVVNRIGQEGDTLFWGRSFAANPYGEVIAEGSTTEEEITIVTCDLELQEEFRRIWPFFRDRRIDSFDGLKDRWGS